MQNDNLCRMEVRGYREPHFIDCRKPPSLYVYVVMGDTDHAGTVKPIKVGYGSACPFLHCDWQIDSEENRTLKEVRIPMHYSKRGWFLLDRAYEEEGNAHGKKQWHEFQKACKHRRAFATAPDPNDPDPEIVAGFPNALLPKAVRDCVKRRDKKIEAWAPVIPEEPKRVKQAESRA